MRRNGTKHKFPVPEFPGYYKPSSSDPQEVNDPAAYALLPEACHALGSTSDRAIAAHVGTQWH